MAMSEKPFSSGKPPPAEGPGAATATVVLVVESERLERVSTATHLRQSGFDVIEAADGDEARRVLDSVPVNVVFADLAMPGQTTGLALLRWLRQRHPAVKTIVTSATETNMAALDGYGIFLSKPYRLVDLDYCLQKGLAAASIPADETGRAMTADPGTKTGPAVAQAPPGSANPSRPPAPGKADGRGDEIARPSMAELSRQLGERAARQRAVDPGAAKAARRAALQAYDRARARRLRVALGFAVAAVAGSAIAYLVPTVLVPTVGSQLVALSQSAAALAEPTSLLETAAATPPRATNAVYTPAVLPAAAPAAAAADSQLALVEPVPDQTPLRRDEAREVQARLRSFGFNPGPVDGVPGAMTEGAIVHYQQDRGQPQTGTVDRQLLEQLRQDPAPRSSSALRAPTRARPFRLDRGAPTRSNPCGRRAIASAGGSIHGCAKATGLGRLARGVAGSRKKAGARPAMT